MTFNAPPPLKDLLSDPKYKKYFLTVPRLGPGIGNQPWQVWAIRQNNRWAGKRTDSYRDAVKTVLQCVKNPEFKDVVLVSRAVEFYPPGGPKDLSSSWCGRCRRLTKWVIRKSHPALRGLPLEVDTYEPRCYFCAIRRNAPHFYRNLT